MSRFAQDLKVSWDIGFLVQKKGTVLGKLG